MGFIGFKRVFEVIVLDQFTRPLLFIFVFWKGVRQADDCGTSSSYSCRRNPDAMRGPSERDCLSCSNPALA